MNRLGSGQQNNRMQRPVKKQKDFKITVFFVCPHLKKIILYKLACLGRLLDTYSDIS